MGWIDESYSGRRLFPSSARTTKQRDITMNYIYNLSAYVLFRPTLCDASNLSTGKQVILRQAWCPRLRLSRLLFQKLANYPTFCMGRGECWMGRGECWMGMSPALLWEMGMAGDET